MSRRNPTAAERYVIQLQNADSRGFAAAEDPRFTERDNPYFRFEHRESWLAGFRRGRAQQNNPTTKGGAE